MNRMLYAALLALAAVGGLAVLASPAGQAYLEELGRTLP